ncbi:chloride channel [Oleoguttula sp. CCFEE 5521]
MSSSSSSRSPPGPSASASRAPPVHAPSYTSDDDDEDGLDLTSHELLNEDPWRSDAAGDEENSVTFKRAPKAQKPSFASRFLSSPFAGLQAVRSNSGPGQKDAKDAAGLDWYVEGPGRRVGYDNLTAIDWIYEYSKERTRVQHLTANAPGLVGQLKLLVDASQIWWVLVATGVAVGGIAAGIDVASDWLGDLKTGVCSNVESGGRLYLNKVFCCWGEEGLAECKDWNSWSSMMGVRSAGGGYIIEYIAFVLLSVLFAAAASLLVTRFSPYAKQSGIPEIKTVLGGFVIRHFLGAWTLSIKAVGLCLAVASGMWLGKEGPLVHVACCCANLFMKLSSAINTNEAKKRETLSAAAASGISVAFGAPIGGVLFSLEQLSYYFPDKTMWASFVCAMVAAVTLQAFDPFRTGKLVLFQVTYHSGWHAFELLPFMVIGVLGGLYGGLFIKLNMRIAAFRASATNPLKGRPVLEVVVVALATALISYPITFLRAQSSELVEYLFAECTDIPADDLGLCKLGIANTGVILILLISSVIGFLLASLTFGLKIPAGILLPSMAVGALFGRSVGLLVEVAQRNHPTSIVFAACEPDIPCVTPGTYAVIGAAAALAGATRMTVSIVVIMFELTGALSYVLPIMVAVMLAKWTGDGIHKRGIYEAWIHLNGYPFLDNKDDTPIPDVPIAQLMTRIDDLICITAAGHSIASLQTLLQQHRFRGFPVITSLQSPTLLGYISRTELTYALASAVSPKGRALSENAEVYLMHAPLADPTTTLDLRPWMDQTPITLSALSSLMLTNDMFQKLGLRYIVFVERGELRGLMTKKDLWIVLNNGEVATTGQGTGALREHYDEEQEDERGLLGEEHEERD